MGTDISAPRGRFDSKVAVVTGAGTGLGATFAAHLHREGALVHLADIDERGLADNVAALGERAVAHHADLTDESAVAAMVARVLELHGRIDVLVNNAGGEPLSATGRMPGSYPDIENVDLEHWQRTFDINLLTTLLCCKHVVPAMRRQSYGRIVNISSGAATGTSHQGVSRAYSSAKAGVLTLTRHLAREVGSHGEITVNSVVPGLILSKPMLRRSFAEMPPGRREGLVAKTALGRLVEPDEIARAVSFLCSDDSSGITGQALWVNAGSYMVS
ncbi:SDR family NAD(P)-dependent oxidoreductase [Streptosporangium sp. NPDC004631]